MNEILKRLQSIDNEVKELIPILEESLPMETELADQINQTKEVVEGFLFINDIIMENEELIPVVETVEEVELPAVEIEDAPVAEEVA